MEKVHKFSIINRKHQLWPICPQIDLHSLSFHCCFWGLFGILVGWFSFCLVWVCLVWFFKYPFSGYLILSPLSKTQQLFLKDKIGYKSQRSVSLSHLKPSGSPFAKQFKESSDSGKANLWNSSKDWDVVLLLQLKLSKKQISKSPDNSFPLKKIIFSGISMYIAFFSGLPNSVNIHLIEQKFHFAFVYPAKASTLSRKHKWNQEVQHIPQD